VQLPAPLLDPRAARPDVRRAVREWLLLQAAGALRPREAGRLLARLRDPLRAARALREAGGPAFEIDLDAALDALARCGARALPYPSPAYPARLARHEDAAPLLWVSGQVRVLAARAVAVVGARAPSAYGRRVARELGRALARAGLVVVSGLARGIDAEAHEGALEAGGLTVAVQGRGPDDVYPSAHRELAARIARRGALLSELPPGAPPRAAHFPLRNRLIAALAACVVVVEARARSGSLSTARHALDQGGEVLAVPGPIHAPTSQGTNRLLVDGAGPCLGIEEILAALGTPVRRRRRAPAGPRSPLVAALEEEPATPDELARRLGRTPQGLAPELLELELEGRVARDRDGRLRVVPAPPPLSSAARGGEPGPVAPAGEGR
jgi:DNA processing protein